MYPLAAATCNGVPPVFGSLTSTYPFAAQFLASLKSVSTSALRDLSQSIPVI